MLFRDVDPLARPGIASFVGGPSLNLENAEVAKFESALGCQRFQDGIQEPLDDRPGLPNVDVEIGADGFDDLFPGHGEYSAASESVQGG